MNEHQVFFVSGIDTDIGKSYATGMLARLWMDKGRKVMTQKLVQTGDHGVSMDIRLHRRIMGIDLTEDDLAGRTCPELFSFPASPHLAAKLDGKDKVDLSRIDGATAYLKGKCEILLIEGAGGLMVPLTEDLLTIDYVAERKLPLILVTSGRLGSLNHALLSLEASERRGIEVAGLVFNYCASADPTISEDTLAWLKRYLADRHPLAWFLKFGKIDPERAGETEIENVGTVEII